MDKFISKFKKTAKLLIIAFRKLYQNRQICRIKTHLSTYIYKKVFQIYQLNEKEPPWRPMTKIML